MADPLFDYQFRFIVIGDSMVGKSSLIRAFVDGKFSDVCDPTVGVDFFARIVDIRRDGVRIKLQIWDTAGQEKFRSITKSYYRNSVGVIFVYDITNQATFSHLHEWVEEAKAHIDQSRSAFVIVGHKSDLGSSKRAVPESEGQAFADFHGAKFMEVSARTGHNVEELFASLASDVYDMLSRGELSMDSGAWDGVKASLARQYASALLNQEPRTSSSDNEVKSSSCC